MGKIIFKGLETPEQRQKFIADLTSDNKSFNKKANDSLGAISEDICNRLDRAHRTAYQEAVRRWFAMAGGDPNSLIGATSFSSKIIQKKRPYDGKQTYVINSTSTVDFAAYEDFMHNCTIDKWYKRYPDEKRNKSNGEFIFDLQWNEGIMGLPRVWKRPNPYFPSTSMLGQKEYINPHFRQFTPLEEFLYGKQISDEVYRFKNDEQTRDDVTPYNLTRHGEVPNRVAAILNVSKYKIRPLV